MRRGAAHEDRRFSEPRCILSRDVSLNLFSWYADLLDVQFTYF